MNIVDETPSSCAACGAELQPGNRFCANCGAAVEQVSHVEPSPSHPEPAVDPVEPDYTPASPPTESLQPQSDPDPSLLETREFATGPYPPPTYPQSDNEQVADFATPIASDDSAWEATETTVPPERGNRTLWIILGIIAFIVLICCCVLPLGLMAIASWDTEFQDELRSTVSMLLG